MAVAHDGEANLTNWANIVTSPTVGNKTTAGSDRIGVLAITVTVPGNVTGATWGGVAMTQVVSAANGTDGRGVVIFYILNPPTASSSVAFTTSGNINYVATASSYSGAHQTTQDGDTSSASGTADPATVDVSSATGEMVVDGLYFLGGATAPAVGASQTQVGNDTQTTWHGSSSYEAGATTTTMSWTLTTPTRWTIAGFSIRAAAAGAATPKRTLLLGVG